MSAVTGQDVFRKLMDVDLILQDGDRMILLRLFLDSIDPDHPALLKLAAEIDRFAKRLVDLTTMAAVSRK